MANVSTLIEALEANSTDERTITYIEGKEKETVISFKTLHQRALGMLYHFQKQGLKAGDELIIFLRNNEMFLDVFWGAILGGIIPVPVAVGISDEHRSKLYKIYNKLQRPYIFTDIDNLDRLKKYAKDNNLDNEFEKIEKTSILSEEITDLKEKGEKYNAKENDICFIQFSSGSTSDPKGVVLTHKNVVLNVLAKAAAGGYTKDDVSLSWMPLTHDMGLIGFHINMIVCGINHNIMATELFSRRPGLWLEKVSDKKASVICSPNFGFKHFLKVLDKKDMTQMDLSCVRVILNGAEPISIRLCNEFMEKLAPFGLKHSSMLPVYGLAEATLAVAFPKWGQDFNFVNVDRHKLKIGDKVTYVEKDSEDSLSFPVVGFAVPDMNIRIGDMEGNKFSDNTVGSILISGPTVTQGYYYDDEATDAVKTKDGWLDTGDLGFIYNDELVITGRSKEIIFAHGQNYYPHDLESVLIHKEGIELGKVAIYGIWSDKLQRDELLVFIIFRGDLNDFIPLAKRVSHCLNEQVGLEVDFVIPVNRIPKTTSGKFQRRLLADSFENGEYGDVLNEIKALTLPKENSSENITSPLQQKLKDICNSVIKENKLDINDNFFDLGIDSLTLAEIHHQIDNSFPDKVDITDLFEYQTITELSNFMERSG